MKSLSSVGLGLSIVFGCLLLALVAELYYLLWWKRRFTNREIGDDYSSPATRELFYMFCLKKPSSLRSSSQELCSSVRITDTLVHHDHQDHGTDHSNNNNNSNSFLFKPFGGSGGGDDSVETELMRLNSLSGPPRFLFTIIEETKEDLESEDGKSRSDKRSRGRSLSDLLLTVETPYLTPLASPPFFTPPLTPMRGFGTPTTEAAEFNKMMMVRSSPPPKLKFLQDAEEKLYKRILIEEAERKVAVQKNDASSCPCPPAPHDDDDDQVCVAAGSKLVKDDEEDGSFITIVVDRNKDRELINHHYLQQQHHSSTSSQVIPLASSPSAFKPAAKKSSIFYQTCK